jgi:hypothetical protein
MGTELIEKAADSFQRKQRKCLNALDEADLFSSPPQVSIAVAAAPAEGQAFALGRWYRLALCGERLVVLDGITTVGEVASPPPSVVDRMKTLSPGVNATVTRVFSLTGKADLSLEFE